VGVAGGLSVRNEVADSTSNHNGAGQYDKARSGLFMPTEVTKGQKAQGTEVAKTLAFAPIMSSFRRLARRSASRGLSDLQPRQTLTQLNEVGFRQSHLASRNHS
jgi:hypothetical protein